MDLGLKDILARHQLVATAIGIGMGVAGLYITGHSLPWASSEEENISELKFYVGGLRNLGNNCFLNVILQALSGFTSFLEFLEELIRSGPYLKGEKDENMPLACALSSLLEELNICRRKQIVLDPRKVMHALSFYVSDFSLTRQQDAAEAFIHLISSLRKEVLIYHVPDKNAYLSITGRASRIHEQKTEDQPECERWKQKLFGPFGGTTCSILTCRSCSSVLSMDFQHFDCLPLSPVLGANEHIVDGCSLTDCLRKFMIVEKLENYRCDRCWHITAINQSSMRPEIDEFTVNKIRNCVNYDACDCRSLFSPEDMKWSRSAYALKQLIISQCPKILCIHVQRASMNMYGEFYKLQGHITFPLSLDLSPFMEAAPCPAQGFLLADMQQRWSTRLDLTSMKMLPGAFRSTGGSFACQELPEKYSTQEFSDGILLSCAPKNCAYTLYSVIEHYGRYGGGHYATYRRAPSDCDNTNSASSKSEWFYISDNHVSQVPEETVLAAEASLLFYQRT